MEENAVDVCAICQNHYIDEDNSPKLVTISCRNSYCAGTLIHENCLHQWVENLITPLQCLNCRVSNLIIPRSITPLRYHFFTTTHNHTKVIQSVRNMCTLSMCAVIFVVIFTSLP